MQIPDSLRQYVRELVIDLSQAPTDLVLLVMLILVSVMVFDAVSMSIRQARKKSGLTQKHSPVSIDGSKEVDSRVYVSESQGLSGRPDLIIEEHGFLIPVEHKPLAKKIRDRYVAQLLVYMRLIEEFEGRKPPYGYLILGRNNRRVKIENSPKRQEWLQIILDQMNQSILTGRCTPKPEANKCSKCDVRKHCSYAVGAKPDRPT